MTTRRNHYVPVWHQKGFFGASQSQLHYLDLTPDEPAPNTVRPGRARELQKQSPKQCFWSQDLYTTLFFGMPNDEIERFLFGAIDNDGAVAVQSVASGDPRAVHESFQTFFSYIDAQKLRTPKGLDWIRARYPRLNQVELMVEMQALRQMHCTMWLEAVREVVSAEDSDVKFIITDHPVTIYNPQCPPNSSQCRYPEDPAIELIGSQTIFPLDANHCLILTNLEYAKEPAGVDLLRPRQNPRHFGQTIARTDAWVRTRKLTRDEVISINHILKSRARRFIAAAEEGWLYPERSAAHDWSRIGMVLLPPEKELWHFGGEIVLGYKDGTSAYQDAFGRTTPGHEYLHKEAPADELQPDQPCGCGSGKTFETCCSDLPSEDRMPWDTFSIRERNLMFDLAIEDILGLDRGKTWEDMRRELSDEQVREIHSAYTSLWPKDTILADLLPRPDRRVFRALYVGLIDPRTIAASVIAWLRYFDEIVVLNPFVNAAFMRPEYSPTESPSQYKEQTIKNVALLIALAPLIHAGVVHLVPDPVEFNETMRQAVWAIAKERRGKIKLDSADLEVGMALGRDDFKRGMARLSDESWRRQIKASSPELSDETITQLIEYMRKQHAADPLALIQPMKPGRDGGQLQVMRGVNFELALFLGQLTGAALYTDQRLTRDDLVAARQGPAGDSPVNERVLTLQLELDINPSHLEAARAEPSSEGFRASLRALAAAALAHSESPDEAAFDAALGKVQDAAIALKKIEPVASDSVSDDAVPETVFEIDARLLAPPNGYGLTAVRRFLVTFGRRRHLSAVPLAILFGRAASGGTDTTPTS
jgi:hypothetical protein